MGDLSALGNDKDAMKAKVAATYPDSKPGAIPGTAGTLLSFVYRMQVGDYIVYPHKPDSTLNFGRIDGEYTYDPSLSLHRNRRAVTWLKTGVPRTMFTEPARFEVGSGDHDLSGQEARPGVPRLHRRDAGDHHSCRGGRSR
jgi:restriction system protein